MHASQLSLDLVEHLVRGRAGDDDHFMMRLEGPYAAFIYGETDDWHFHVSSVLLLDPAGGDGWSPQRYEDTLARRIHLVPQLRWRLHPDPTGLSRPVMADDPDFDIANHVERIALPSGAGEAELTALWERAKLVAG